MEESAQEMVQARPIPTLELQRALSAAIQTTGGFCSAASHCEQRLGEIEQLIEETSSIDGLRVLRFRLLESLQGLREEAQHRYIQMSETLAQLREQLEVAQGTKAAVFSVSPALDPLTGLETRESAERAMAAAIEQGVTAYAALFVVDRLHLCNARYGYATGDQILSRVHRHLATCLSSEDHLFRWTGPAFIALIQRAGDAGEVQEEIDRINSLKLAAGVQIGNESVVLPIVCNSLLLALSQTIGLAELTQRIDAFIGAQTRG
jgi:GGDEF domain-containing protein